MANLKLLIVLSIIVAVVKSEDTDIRPEPQQSSLNTTITTSHPHPHTTTKPTSTTSTPSTSSPNSTTPTPSTSTTPTPSTSTTPTPSTSTTSTPSTSTTPTLSPNTTTPTPHTSTSTPKPTTSTSAAPPTTTPAPKPVPEPETGSWTVNFTNSNHSCMVVDAAIQLEFLLENSTKKINLPVNASVVGGCVNGTDIDAFVLKWDNNSFTMNFNKSKDNKFEAADIEAKFVNLVLPNGPKNYTLVHQTPEFATPLGNSYKCAKVQTFNLTEQDSNKTIAYLHIGHVQLQAFANTTGHKFDSAIDCEASPITSDIVPIVVGCVLAALVIMIMVTYLIARRRCQARGYLSMFAETKSESDYIPMKNLSCFK